MCCATNRTNPSGGPETNGWTADTCLPNGLCENKIYDTQTSTMIVTFWRDQCTSPHWAEGSCLNVCTGSDGDNHTSAVTPCDGTANSTEWCCGSNVTSCCGTSSAIKIAQLLGASTSTSSTATVPSSTFTATATSNVAPSNHTSVPTTSVLSTGDKTGIGVGVAVGALALLAIATFYVKRRGKKGSKPTPAEDDAYQTGYAYSQLSQNTSEPGKNAVAYEKPANEEPVRHELEGSA